MNQFGCERCTVIRNRDIIIFGDDWGRYPSTIQHIGRVLARENRILWIGSLGLRRPKVSFHDLLRVVEKGKRIIRPAERSNEAQYPSVRLVNPFIIPFHDVAWIYALNMTVLRTSLGRIMSAQQYHDPILITASPIVHGLVGTLGERSSHYFCLDDFTLFDGAFKRLGELEQSLVSKVDTCFSISDVLMQTRKTRWGNDFFLPQGVDVNHFAPSDTPLPPGLQHISKPVIGFFGLFTSWVDIELIVACARRYPKYSIVLFGRTHIDLSLFNGIDNIHYMGEVPFSELPKHARCFDVGIIPFRINELTIACNPLKLLEYLALDIPVVSTNMPEVAKFRPDVDVANDHEEFIAMVGAAAEHAAKRKPGHHRSVSERYSWEAITEDISTKILSVESMKGPLRHP